MNNLLLVMLLCITTGTFSQTIQGKVAEKENKKGIPFASVYFTDYQLGVICDSTGRFELTADISNETQVRVTALGFKSFEGTVDPTKAIEIELDHTHIDFEEVMVVATGVVSYREEDAIYIDKRPVEELTTNRMGDIISEMPGVYQSTFGSGISKPVVRGLQGNRIVTFLNGMRLDNQQWGGDHGMAVSTLGIGSVSVVKGPASLAYGPDALGGAIHFIDQAYLPQGETKLAVAGRFESATMGYQTGLNFKTSRKNIRLMVAGMYNDYADYQLPSGQFAANSRFKEAAGKIALGYNNNNWVMHLRYIYSRSRVGLPGHTHDSIINPAEFQVDAQGRNNLIPAQLTENHFVSLTNRWFKNQHSVTLLVGNTFNQLREFEEKFFTPAMNLRLNNSLYSFKWDWRLGAGFRWTNGLMGGYQINSNGDAWEEDVLIPNYNQFDNGLYSLLQYDRHWWGLWKLRAGARIDMRQLSVFDSEVAGDFNGNYQSFNASAGATYEPGSGHLIRITASSGFRAPHVSELVSNGAHHGALRYEVGDVELKTEQGTQLDFVYELKSRHLRMVVNPFYNVISNYIALSPQDSLVDGLPLFNYEQIDQATLYGGEIAFHYHPHFAHWLHIQSGYSNIVGLDNAGGYLPLIPQNRVNSTFRFNLERQFKKKFKITNVLLRHQFFFEQNRVASIETTSPQYNLIDLEVNLKFNMKTPLEIAIGARNVLNESYIDHLSRLKNIQMQHPGRNFFIQLKYTPYYKQPKRNPNDRILIIETIH